MSFINVIKAEFLTLLLQSSVSYDPLEIIAIFCFAAQNKKKNDYNYYYVENSIRKVQKNSTYLK